MAQWEENIYRQMRDNPRHSHIPDFHLRRQAKDRAYALVYRDLHGESE